MPMDRSQSGVSGELPFVPQEAKFCLNDFKGRYYVDNRMDHRRRRSGISEFLLCHTAATPAQVVQAGYGVSADSVRKVLNSMVKKNEIKRVGSITVNGRKEHVYSNGALCSGSLEHECGITEIATWFWNWFWIREPNLEAESDAYVKIGDVPMFFEYDTGTMSLESKVRERWKSYTRYTDPVIVFSRSKKRMEGVMSVSESIKNQAIFTCTEWLQQGIGQTLGGLRITLRGDSPAPPTTEATEA